MYSIKNVFKQEPAVIVSVIMAWVTVLVVAGVIAWSKETLSAGQTALTATLLLAYVRQATVTKDALAQLDQAQQDAELRGIQAGKTAQRPLRAPQPPDA